MANVERDEDRRRLDAAATSDVVPWGAPAGFASGGRISSYGENRPPPWIPASETVGKLWPELRESIPDFVQEIVLLPPQAVTGPGADVRVSERRVRQRGLQETIRRLASLLSTPGAVDIDPGTQRVVDASTGTDLCDVKDLYALRTAIDALVSPEKQKIKLDPTLPEVD